jgi:hypothetical protein
LPAQAEDRAEEPGEPALHMRRPSRQRPARFVVGLDVLDHTVPVPAGAESAAAEPDDAGARDTGGSIIPESWCTSAPLEPAVFVGRVVEVADSGEVTARVWELPGGRENIATLSPEELGHRETHRGAVLRIWTWLELPEGPHAPGANVEPVPQIRVELHNRPLTNQERSAIVRLLDHEDKDDA